MTLYMIGIGLNDEKDITVKGFEAIKRCDEVYLETYTSQLKCEYSALEKYYGKKIVLVDRDIVENKAEETILKNAKDKNVAFLVIGDILAATTHVDIFLRARKENINVEFIHNASVLSAVSIVGLELYKYGKTTSMPFPQKSYRPETAYSVIENNLKFGLHTLVLLDLDPENKKYMKISEAIEFLFDIEKRHGKGIITPTTKCIGCVRLGSPEKKIFVASTQELLKKEYENDVQCLIIPGTLHFIEEEMLEYWKKNS